MIVKTLNPILVGEQDFSNAPGPKDKGKKEKTGFFSKQKREERKTVRQAKREERRKLRKARYGARPLIGMVKAGKKYFKDRLPKLKRKANGNYEKTLPDGKTIEIPKEQVTVIPAPKNQPNAIPAVIETKDLQTPAEVVTQVVNGEVEVSKNYTEQQTEVAVDDNGVEQVYKKADVVESDSPEAKKPMSTGLKIGIAVGSAAVLGLIIYLVVKKK
jgi:hypothetical protein